MTAELCTAPNLVVEALAGTGKTFAMTNGVKLMHWMPLARGLEGTEEQKVIWEHMLLEGHPGICHLTSFSTDATEQLKKGLPEGCTASSTYGMGFNAAKRAGIGSTKSEGKYYRILTDFLGGRWEQERKYPGLVKIALTLGEKARLALKRSLSGEELEQLAEWYGVELGDLEITEKAVNHLLKVGLQQDQVFDYTDMVWIPVLKGLVQKKYDHLIVDEYQDMGIAQQEICYRSARRLLCIGDPNQAIYGFIGADSNATKNFCRALGRTARGVETLPLTLTRRCAKAIVRKANEVRPTGLTALPEAPEGDVTRTSFWEGGGGKEKYKAFGPKDMVICPTNAPLVSLLFKMVKAGQKAYVRKSDIVDSMRTYVSEFTKGVGELRLALKRNVERFSSAKPTRANRASLDKFTCMLEIAQNAATITDVGRTLSSLFADDNRPGATRLSSVHRAKGLEADKVFFWEWNQCGRWAKQAWEVEQAKNLQYVGITRAKTSLVLVDGER